MLEWLIVGGGVHGTHLSLVLTEQVGIPRDLVRVLDPQDAPLERWDECTENTGMALLRSPYVHHIDLAPFSLRQFSRSAEGQRHGRLLGFYRRPALPLFRAHCDRVVREHGLAELRIRGRATGLRRCRGGLRVLSDRGSLYTRRVLLAVGSSEHPHWPEWARSLREDGGAVAHVFDPGFRTRELPDGLRLVVVGGGSTAAQTAMALAERAPGRVTLLARHPMRVRQFDSDPGWVGPRLQRGFQLERDLDRRREIISSARHRGSMPPDVAAALRRALVSGAVTLRTARIAGASVDPSGEVVLTTSTGELRCNRVVLATGFEVKRPGGEWLDRAAEELRLPCAPCGYPIVDGSLCWQPGIHVTGPLAELEIGPVARNIVGARLCAERLRSSGARPRT